MTCHTKIQPLALSVIYSKADAEKAHHDWTRKAQECLDKAGDILRKEFCMVTLLHRQALVERENSLLLDVSETYTESELRAAQNRVDDLIGHLSEYQEALGCAATAAEKWHECNTPADPVGASEMWGAGQ